MLQFSRRLEPMIFVLKPEGDMKLLPADLREKTIWSRPYVRRAQGERSRGGLYLNNSIALMEEEMETLNGTDSESWPILSMGNKFLPLSLDMAFMRRMILSH